MRDELKKVLIVCLILLHGPLLWAQEGYDVYQSYPDADAFETQEVAEYAPSGDDGDYEAGAEAAHDWDAWAQGIREEAEHFVGVQEDPEDDEYAVDWDAWAWEVWDDPAPPSRERFAFRNRTFELSLLQTNFHIGNTFIAYRDFFQGPFRILGNLMRANGFADFLDDPGNYYIDNIIVDLEGFFDGFMLNFGLDFAPLSININIRDEWGFGLDIGHVSATGNLNLPAGLLNLRDGTESFGAGGAIFAEFGVPVFFHTHGFRVNVRPAAYVPLVHLRPGVTYTRNADRIGVSYDMRVFSGFSLEGMFGDGNGDTAIDVNSILGGMGYDISLGVEYPLFPWLSVGVNLVNLPLFPGRLDYYMRRRGHAYFNPNIDVGNLLDYDGDLFDYIFDSYMEDAHFGSGAGRRILRPFTMLFYANYFPVGTPTIVIIPSLGFSINQLHARVASMEGGLSARFDLANILITTIGINYNDRMWRNSFDLALNLRALEIGMGMSLQSPRFVNSFQGMGLGVNFGIKMGW